VSGGALGPQVIGRVPVEDPSSGDPLVFFRAMLCWHLLSSGSWGLLASALLQGVVLQSSRVVGLLCSCLAFGFRGHGQLWGCLLPPSPGSTQIVRGIPVPCTFLEV
jgi:hypothetical protein